LLQKKSDLSENWIISNFRGVFVRIKEKNLHVDCFKCSTCGSSLKNVGKSLVFSH
jgi:LIM domain